MAKKAYLDSDGNTEIFAKDLGNVLASVTEYKKLFLQNKRSAETYFITGSILEFEGSDGNDFVKWALCPLTLSCPFNFALTLLSGGDLVASTKYYYRITAFNENGETGGSLEKNITTDVTNKSIKLTWDKIQGADGYIIYRSTNQIYTNARRDVIEDPDILEWIDTGQVADPSSPYGWPGINTDFDLPIENTTAGESPDYGTPPTLDTIDINFDILQSGEQKALWVGIYTTLSTPEEVKNFILDFPETV